ncbi:MAG: glutathione S-transferase N-terminal domain-containing protein [Candidatus Nealsonbacteria bacterium]|nr:glutathione S-transferase N-terminal domain-containing protein [Candidatus Nealsonbacteria bacterium]
MKKVKVYSTPTCVYCVTLKRFLKEKNIEFEEINVADNEAAAKEMVEASGQMGVPVVDIDGEIIVGFNRDKISSALEINK